MHERIEKEEIAALRGAVGATNLAIMTAAEEERRLCPKIIETVVAERSPERPLSTPGTDCFLDQRRTPPIDNAAR